MATGTTKESTEDLVTRLVAQQLANVSEQHKREMREMQDRLDAMTKAMAQRGVDTLIPLHAGGSGHDISETWSQWEQELSRLGLTKPLSEIAQHLDLEPIKNTIGEVESGVKSAFDRLDSIESNFHARLTALEEATHVHEE